MTDPTNNPEDDFFSRLAAADPLDHDALPSATDPSARQLLENAMTTNTPHSANQGSDQTFGANDRKVTDPIDPSEFRFDHKPASKQRGRGMLVGAAAAVLLLVGGLLIFSPDNTPSAVAAVHSAASATLDADTARITTEFTLEGTDGVESGEVSGQFDAAYADDDISFSLDAESLVFDGPEDAPSPDDIPVSEARLVDDILYVQLEDQWLAVDTDGILGNVVNQFADPRQVLETVQDLTETTEVGNAEVDGVSTIHYQSVIDLGDETLAQSGWLAFEGMGVDSDGEVTVDLYVDDDRVMRQLDLSGTVSDSAGSDEAGTFHIATRFYDIGQDITVEAPEGVVPIDPLQGLLGDE